MTRRCMDIKACAERMLEAPAQLWIIFAGAQAGLLGPVLADEPGRIGGEHMQRARQSPES